MRRRRGERGNIFFTLFGALILVGIIGAATMVLMRGPLGTVIGLNQRAKVESQLQIARRLAALDAAQVAGDCDGDTYIEPSPPDTSAPGCPGLIAGGGCLPATVGAAKTDPWGTLVGYCAWNHGPVQSGGGCSAELLSGTNGTSRTAIAVVSAGPDRTFQTTCGDDPAYVTKGGDDIVAEWTFAEAEEGVGGGLWSLKSGNPDAITTSKDVEISSNATFSSGTTASFQGNASFGAGSTLSLTNGGLFMLPTETTVTSCNPANTGLLRRNTAGGTQEKLQICDGATSTWLDVGTGAGGGSIDALSDGVSDLAAGNNLFLGDAGGSLLAGGAHNVAVGVSAGMNLSSGSNNVLLGYNAGSAVTTESNNILIGNAAGLPSAGKNNFLNIGGLLFGDLAGGKIGVGINNPSHTLDVAGTLNATGAATLGSTLGVTGDTTVGGTLGVTGATTLNSTLHATGATTLDNSLSVGGVSAFGNTATFNGDIHARDGSAGTPSISFTNATTMGLFNSSGSLGMAVGGSQAALLGAGGFDVANAVGASSFRIGGTGAGEGLFSNSAGGLALNIGGAKKLELTSGGSVGIGVASPNTKLDVGGAIKVGMDSSSCGASLYGAIRYNVAADQVQVCSSNDSWVTIGASGGGGGGAGSLWSAVGDGRIYYTSGNVGVGTNDPKAPLHTNGDFLVTGTYTGTASVPVSGAGTRMFFDPDTAAFRAGRATGTEWDNADLGRYSVAMGYHNKATGIYSVAIGNDNTATSGGMALGQDNAATGQGTVALGDNTTAVGSPSAALGSLSTAKGDYSIAAGYFVTASGNWSAAFGRYVVAGDGVQYSSKGDYSVAFGLANTGGIANYARVTGNGSFGIFMQDQHNRDLSADHTMGLFGGSFVIDPNTQATLMAPAGGTALDVNGKIGANQYCDVNGANCFVATDVSGGPGSGGNAYGNDREVQFNSAGKLWSDSVFTFTSSGRLLLASHNDSSSLYLGGGNETVAGQYNTAIGVGAGAALTTGTGNTFIGNSAATNATTTDQSVVIGTRAGLDMTTGSENTFIGWTAGSSNTTGGANVYLGRGAGSSGTTATSNTFLGHDAGTSVSTATDNVFVGREAGYLNGAGSADVYIGRHAGGGTAGNDATANVMIGYRAGAALQTGGDYNVALGYQAGATLTTGAKNILIGQSADVPAPGTNEYLNIGNLLFGDIGASSGNPRVGAKKYCDDTLTNCFTASAIATGSAPAAGSSYQIQYNSGGSLGASANLAYIPASATLKAGIYDTNANAGAYKLNGITVLTYPNGGGDSTSFAVGPSALAAQNASSLSNTALGVGAGQLISSGNQNTAVGASALASATTANSNVAVGYSTLQYATSGSNVAVGTNALQGVSGTPLTGGANTAVGNGALKTLQGAAPNNTAVGYQAMNTSTTASNNAAFGYRAMLYNQTGTSNTAVGNLAMQGANAAKLSGANNTAVGDSALTGIQTTANSNTAVGALALAIATTATRNTAVGVQALYYGDASSDNIAVGYNAMQGTSAISGTQNTAVGGSALINATSGSNNTAVGFNALYYSTTGSSNTAVGVMAMVGSNGGKLSGNNNTALGNSALSGIQTTANSNTAVGAGALSNATTAQQQTAVGYNAMNGTGGTLDNSGYAGNVAAGYE
jgi:hypothetical protein